ncbi:hypothetical protein ABH923_002706 [Leifsonia sp. EB41]
MLEPALTKTSWPSAVSASGVWAVASNSPRAIRLASLSTATVRPVREASAAATSRPFQPGIRDGETIRPVLESTGPGMPIPMPRSSWPGAPCIARSSSALAAIQARTRSGPDPMSIAAVREASSRPDRSNSPKVAWCEPRSAAATTPEPASTSSARGRRPPCETPSPASRRKPAESSASTRCATVEGDRPVWRAMSARDPARPERTRWRMPPGVAGAFPGAAVCVPLISAHPPVRTHPSRAGLG